MTKIMLCVFSFFFFCLDRFKAIYNFLLRCLHILFLSRLLLAGDLKDGKNKGDKKDPSNVGNDSKKADGKGIILVTFSIDVQFHASLLAFT